MIIIISSSSSIVSIIVSISIVIIIIMTTIIVKERSIRCIAVAAAKKGRFQYSEAANSQTNCVIVWLWYCY